MQVTGYKYNTEEEAIAARKQCADHYGLPVSPDDVTQYWVDYQEASLNTPIFWYIVYHDSIDFLGTPTDFEIIIDEN